MTGNDPTPPTVQSVVVNAAHGASAQRSMVTDVTINFAGSVFLDAGAFTLAKLDATGALTGLINTNASVSDSAGNTSVVLTFSGNLVDLGGSLSDGNYYLTTVGNRIHAADTGADLDGNRDGLAGGDRIDAFFRRFGDTDGDRDVDTLDYARFRNAYSKTLGVAGYQAYFDSDSDTDIDALDYARFRQRFGTQLAATTATSPAAPGISSLSPDTGFSATDGLTNTTAISLTGVADAGSFVLVYEQTAGYLGTTTAGPTGLWTLDLSSRLASQGTYHFYAAERNFAGMVGTSSALLDVTIDTTPPVAPAISGISDDTGTNANDEITSDTTLVFSGTAEAGSRVTLAEATLGTLGSVNAAADGSWTIDLTATTLAQGTYAFTTTATDAAGNTSGTGATFGVTVDTAAPGVPAITGISNDTGTSSTDGITNSNSPALLGTAAPGSSVHVYEQTAGLLTTVTAAGDGTWSLDLTSYVATQGNYQFTAVAVDVAGNASAASAGFAVTIDRAAPAAPSVSSTNSVNTGNVSTTLTFVVSGTAEPGASVRVSQSGVGLLGTTTANSTGTWTFQATGAPSNGSYVFSATATDAAGNASGGSNTKTLLPNIVMLYTDDQRADEMSVMPLTNQLLGGSGTTFQYSFSPTSVSAPSRASLLTGLFAQNTGELSNTEPIGGFPNFDNSVTLATRLHDVGYRTGLYGKYETRAVVYEAPLTTPPGWDEWHAVSGQGDFSQGSSYNYTLTENGVQVHYGTSESDYSTYVLTNKAEDFIRTSSADAQPFFLYYAIPAPHSAFVPAPTDIGALNGIAANRPPSFNVTDYYRTTQLSDSTIATLDLNRQRHLEMLLSVDRAVQDIYNTLISVGQLQNTVLVYAGDNGYHWGEHAIAEGKSTSYEESIRVPLIVRDGRNPVQRTATELVANVDVNATFLAAAGLSTTGLNGVNLAPILAGQDPVDWRDTMFLAQYNQAAGSGTSGDLEYGLRTSRYKYIQFVNAQRVELYDLQNDPYELTNIAADPANTALLAQFAAKLLTYLPSDVLPPTVSNLAISMNVATTGTQTLSVSADVTDASSGGSAVRTPEYFIDNVGNPGFGVAMTAADGQFNSVAESTVGTILPSKLTTLTAGRHLFYVRGRDVPGNWSATQSIPFYLGFAGSTMPIKSLTASAPTGTTVFSVTLAVAKGTITVNTNVANGVDANGVTNNGTGSVTLTGTRSAIANTFNAGTAVNYLGAATDAGPVSLTLDTSLGEHQSFTLFIAEPPIVIGGVSGTTNYVANLSGLALTSAATVTGPTHSYNNATLTVLFKTGADTTDRIYIAPQGDTAGLIGLTGTNNTTITYNGVAIGTYTGGTYPFSLVATFNTSATAASFQALLTALRYTNLSTTPTTTTRSLQFKFAETSGAVSNTASKSITITLAPQLSGVAGTVLYNASAAPVVLSAGATVPSGTPNISGSTLTATDTNAGPNDRLSIIDSGTGAGVIGVSGANVTYGGVTIGTLSPSNPVTGTTTLAVTLNASANEAALQALLRAIGYSSAATSPSVFTRTVQIVWTDSVGSSTAPAVVNVNVNPPPTISGVAANNTYVANASPSFLAAAATYTDSYGDYANSKLTITITNGGPNDRLTIVDEGTGAGQIGASAGTLTYGGSSNVVGTYSPTTATTSSTPLVITFNGTATQAAIQAALRRVAYYSSASSPNIFNRTITIVGTDGNNVAAAAVGQTLVVRIPPAIAGTPSSVSLNAGNTALIAPAATVTASSGMSSGSLTVQFTAGDANDRVNVQNVGNGANQVGVAGTNVSYGGTVVGTLSAATGGTTSAPLVISFNASATTTAVQAVLQNVVYSSTSASPAATTRTISLLLTDSAAISGTAVSVSVVFTTAPILTLATTNRTYYPAGQSVLVASGATLSVASNNYSGGSLTFTTTNGGPNDKLTIIDNGTGAGVIGVSGTNVTYGGTTIGTLSPSNPVSSTTPLVVTFTSNATQAAVQALVQDVAYSNAASSPSAFVRTVTIKLTDGGGAFTTAPTINVNIAAKLGLTTASYNVSSANATTPLNVATDATFTAGSSTLSGATLTLKFNTGTANDRVQIRNDGTGSGQIGVSGTNVTYGGTTIGTFSPSTWGTGTTPLAITFNSSATAAAIQALMRAIQFVSLVSNPAASDRVLEFDFVDGSGLATPITTTIHIV